MTRWKVEPLQAVSGEAFSDADQQAPCAAPTCNNSDALVVEGLARLANTLLASAEGAEVLSCAGNHISVQLRTAETEQTYQVVRAGELRAGRQCCCQITYGRRSFGRILTPTLKVMRPRGALQKRNNIRRGISIAEARSVITSVFNRPTRWK
jgi:hypothetical protein